ncbi:hypothetical protein [Marinifilum caeruleilacunae]|uniref:Uncharacterized protein n=1 Tax=Marinifilum caeruleilacunae TaxID=2499076 RepID=A0ABX1X037_9BACT|nr:hypothetical protein [Marinifilum caeruleilacunae]NOU61752.1 hypothetical protein [Marinifilum caeruleilacunae]
MTQNTWKLQLFTEDTQIIEICKKYWQLQGENRFDYQYSPAQIGKIHDIDGPKIPKIVSKNSQLKINCDNHAICGNSIRIIKARREIKLDIFQEKGSCLCETCERQKRFENLEISKDEAKRMMNYAFEQKKWTMLSNKQLGLLILISQCQTKKDIVNNIFNKVKLYSIDSIIIWEYLERLDDLKLIWIERNQNHQIIHYHTHPKLKSTLKSQFPKSFSKDLILQNTGHNKSQLYITLDPTHNRKSNIQPIYSGTHIFKSDVILKANKKYNYQIWDNKDGTVVFQLTDPDNKNNYDESREIKQDVDDLAYNYYMDELKLN